jgi:Condensation domain/TubC N-terminal docking domain
VKSPVINESVHSIVDLLGHLHKKDVNLWSEKGELRFKGPKGALTPDEIERLRSSKEQVLRVLGSIAVMSNLADSCATAGRLECAPLTACQLNHWNSYQLRERPAIRQIASAMHVFGKLNLDVLNSSLKEIVSRQSALRTQIVVCGGVPVQKISNSTFELVIDDLTNLPACVRETNIQEYIATHIAEPINVACDPLFGASLLRLDSNHYVLIIAMEHLISDGASLNILMRDLSSVYSQKLRGREISLPPIGAELADYAVWQRYLNESWLKHHGAYWENNLLGSPHVKFPDDKEESSPEGHGWTTLRFVIDRATKDALLQWCRLRRTTLVMCLFATYISLVLRWCDVKHLVIQTPVDGRSNPKVANTIGFFASMLYVQVEYTKGDTFVDLLNKATEAYCLAHEHADFGLMEAQGHQLEIARNTSFNWLRGSRLNLSGPEESDFGMKTSPIAFQHPMLRGLKRDIEPSVLFYEFDDEIVVDIYYPASRFSALTMRKFAENFLLLISTLLVQPHTCVSAVRLL